MLKSRKIFLKVLILLLNQPTFGSMVYFFLAFFLGTFHIKKWEQKKKKTGTYSTSFTIYSWYTDIYLMLQTLHKCDFSNCGTGGYFSTIGHL